MTKINDKRRSQKEIQSKLEELYKAQSELCDVNDAISVTAASLIFAKIQVIEWVLGLDWFTIEHER